MKENKVYFLTYFCVCLYEMLLGQVSYRKIGDIIGGLSQLKLDQTLWETTDEFISPTVRFTNVFYHIILALHAGPISKFILSIVDPVDCPKIDILIYFLSRSGIQHLILQLPTGYNVYKLPSSFFTCLQLRHLTLQRCLVRPPPVFRELISLELSQVTISTEDFGNFISRCLLLEHLVLDNANNIEINVPKLRSFVFTGNIHFIHLKCVPLLAKISHESMESSVKAGNYDLVVFFKSIEHLHWDYSNFRDQVKYQLRFPPLLNSLKRLYLSELCFDELVEVAWALCLLRSSPYLEELEIKGPGDLSGELIDYVPWWTVDEIPASFSDVTYNYLRTVKIKGVVGAGVDMQLIKVLLAKSPVLLRMVIDPYVEGDHSLEILAKITKYQRASPQAEVIYNVNAYPGYKPA